MRKEKGRDGLERMLRDYKMKVLTFWSWAVAVLLIGALCCSWLDPLEGGLKSEECETVEYTMGTSQLSEQSDCLLCGSSAHSTVAYYRQFHAIGLISLNDWYVLGFECVPLGKSKKEVGRGSVFRIASTSLSTIQTDRFSRGREDIRITWKERPVLDTSLIRSKLCQDCLTKVANTLSVSKCGHKTEAPLPFCLIDFQTLDLYSVQESHACHEMRDYRVELLHSDSGMEIKAYYLPLMERREGYVDCRKALDEQKDFTDF